MIWLPDLGRWAEVVAWLLRPGGRLYLIEFHRIVDIRAERSTVSEEDYLAGREVVYEVGGDYAVSDAVTQHNRTPEWVHPLGEVVTKLAESGLRIEFLKERCETYFARVPPPYLEEVVEGLWVPPRAARASRWFTLSGRGTRRGSWGSRRDEGANFAKLSRASPASR